MEVFVETFKRYMDNPKTEYALHLDGPWGSGKTYFVMKDIHSILEERGVKLVYISLNGMRDVNEIGENLFLQIVSPSVAKSYVVGRGAINLFKNLIPIGSPGDINLTDIDTTIQKFISNKKMDKILLCLDDLERIDRSLSIESVFGYVNSNFIEHNNVKTLFISNSEEISQTDEFILLKEKLIGRTINFVIDNNRVIDEIIKDEYSTSKLNSFYNTNAEVMNALFSSIEKLNLRTIKFVFEIVDEIFTSLEEKNIKIENEDMLSIFVCTLLLGIEYKNGTIQTLEEAEEKLNPYNLFYNVRKEKETENPLYRLLNGNLVIGRFFSYFSSIAEFVITGHFNNGLLEQEINEKYKQQSAEDLCFSVVESYYDYELNEVEEATKDFINAIKKGYYSPLKYPYIYMILKEIVSKNYVQIDGDLFDIVSNGLTKSLEDKSETICLDSDHRFDRYFSGCSDENSEKLIRMIRGEIKQLKEDKMISRTNLFMKAIEDNDVSFINHYIMEYSVSDSLFETLNTIQFNKKLPLMKNRSIRLFIAVLNEMYLRISNSRDTYHVEQQFMVDLRNKLISDLKEIEIDVLKQDLVQEVINELNKVIKHVGKKIVEKE